MPKDPEYNGALPGSTPANDADLHTSDNPFGPNGTLPIDASNSSDFPAPNQTLGTPYGYFTNPPTSSGGNPYADGVPVLTAGERSAASSFAEGLDATYSQVYGYQAGGDAPAASADPAQVYWDEGYGKSGLGRS